MNAIEKTIQKILLPGVYISMEEVEEIPAYLVQGRYYYATAKKSGGALSF